MNQRRVSLLYTEATNFHYTKGAINSKSATDQSLSLITLTLPGCNLVTVCRRVFDDEVKEISFFVVGYPPRV